MPKARVPRKKLPNMEFASIPLNASLLEGSSDIKKTGLVYLSRIPPKMTPMLLRQLLSPYGTIGRIYLAPKGLRVVRCSLGMIHCWIETKNKRQLKGKKKEFGRLGFEEGWVEFTNKAEAKAAVERLNTQRIGTSKGKPYYDDLWVIKYLPKFKWHHLTDQMGIHFGSFMDALRDFCLAHEKAAREQRLRVEISQARKQNQHYLRQTEKAQEVEIIREKKRQKVLAGRAKDVPQEGLRGADLEDLRKHIKIKQRKPISREEIHHS
jgi:ESF2/ABP1 family protein